MSAADRSIFCVLSCCSAMFSAFGSHSLVGCSRVPLVFCHPTLFAFAFPDINLRSSPPSQFHLHSKSTFRKTRASGFSFVNTTVVKTSVVRSHQPPSTIFPSNHILNLNQSQNEVHCCHHRRLCCYRRRASSHIVGIPSICS